MILLKLNESSASLRVVPLPPLLRVSDSTSAATNESGRTFYFTIGGVNYGSGGSISAISEAMGLYTCNFAASKISVSGPGMVFYGLPTSSLTALQVSAPFMVVPVDSYDSMRFGMFALPNVAAEAAGGLITHGTGTGQLHTSNGSVGLKAQAHSGATIKGIENYANISSVTLNAGFHSGATIDGLSNKTFFQTSVQSSVWSGKRSDWTTPGSFGEYVYSQVTGTSTGTVKGVENYANISSVTLNAGTHSGATIQGLSNYANISNVTLHAGTHSNVTIQGVTRVNSSVTIADGEYSGVTVAGLSNKTYFQTSVQSSVWSGKRSDWTTPGSFGEYVYSQVTGISTGTVFGVTDVGNFPGGSGSTPGAIAQAVWANSGRTLDGDSIATIFVHPRSVWSTLRSAYTTPGSFGEYVYSQVTGTSTGTVQGVTRALNLSSNGDKTGYSISGTKTTLDALNDIDGSQVTLHAGVHSGATVQGLNNYANISNVTLAAGTHSGATVQGVNRVNSGVTLNADTHSGATIAGIVAGGLLNATLASGFLSAAKLAAGTIDAAALATDAGQEIADRVLMRSFEGGADSGRSVGQAFAVLRNRVLIQGSVGTVYMQDDTSSLWTFSPSLGTAPISGVDPTG
jgi:hypothetical protein